MRDSLYIHILYHLLISSMLNMNGIAVNTVMEIELKKMIIPHTKTPLWNETIDDNDECNSPVYSL